MVKGGLATVAVLVAVLAEAAGAATTTFDQHGTVLVDGRKVFPIVLASAPPRPGPRVVLAGVRSTRARTGRVFRIELRLVTDTGGPPAHGPVHCGASVAGRSIRVRAKGWQSGRPYCSWKLPRSSRGKRLRGVVRVNGLEYLFTRRIGS